MTSTDVLEQEHATRLPGPVAPRTPRQGSGWVLLVGLLLLVAGAWLVVLRQDGTTLPGPGEVLDRVQRFGSDLLGLDREEPAAWQEGDSWRRVGGLALDTVVMSVLAAGLAGLLALLTLAPAARTLTLGEFGRGGVAGWAAYLLARGLHTVTRSVPEVVWAFLVVFVLQPGVLAGAVALALHEVGVLGRLGTDVVEDIDRRPLRALRAAGAGRVALLFYGVLPQALPQLVTFLLYRWEVVVRASIVVGFITSAGLGFALRLDLSFRRWTDVALVLAVYVLLVWVSDLISSALRRLAR